MCGPTIDWFGQCAPAEPLIERLRIVEGVRRRNRGPTELVESVREAPGGSASMNFQSGLKFSVRRSAAGMEQAASTSRHRPTPREMALCKASRPGRLVEADAARRPRPGACSSRFTDSFASIQFALASSQSRLSLSDVCSTLPGLTAGGTALEAGPPGWIRPGAASTSADPNLAELHLSALLWQHLQAEVLLRRRSHGGGKA